MSLPFAVFGEEEEALPTFNLPTQSIVEQRVALEDSLSNFSMPITGLQYEPLVDVQSRNSVESQGDVTIRGGIFENTGFMLGGATLFDPQTGHYFAEIPVAPRMLTLPQVLTGSQNAAEGFNSSVGSIKYGWSKISAGGEVSLGGGESGLFHQNIYSGFSLGKIGDLEAGADFDFAHSESDGAVPDGDHDFNRYSGRFQLAGANSQTDLFYGYQSKFFGWPNMYTPYGVPETENLQTNLAFLNHLQHWDHFELELSAYYRRNKDDYEFNRNVPGLYNPYQHETEVNDLSVRASWYVEDFKITGKVEYISDEIESTSLTYGHFDSRKYTKTSMMAETNLEGSGGEWNFLGGVTMDTNNRANDSEVSPLGRISYSSMSGSRSWTVYVDASEATQVAGYTAIASNPDGGLFRGNHSLDRESATNFEAGYVTKFGNIDFQAALFQRNDNDLVDWTYTDGVSGRSANNVDIETIGLELLGGLTFNKGRMVIGYTALSKSEDYGLDSVDASFYALNYARHRLTVALVYKLLPGLEIRSDNEFRIQKENTLRTNGVDDAVLSSLGLFYFPESIEGLELSLSVENLWDSRFEELPSVPASPRQIGAGATWRW